MADSAELTRVIFARHGQTEWNLQVRFQGKTDVPLTDTGKHQAHALAERLSSWPLEAVYTSPLSRALYTANAVAERHNLTPIILPELQEINFASWEGQSIPNLKTEQHEAYSRWRSDPFFNPPSGAENKSIAVISHGGIMRAMYAVFLGLNPHKVWNMDVTNCAMSGVEMRNGRPCLVFANDDLHIRAGEAGQKLPVWSDTDGVRL